MYRVAIACVTLGLFGCASDPSPPAGEPVIELSTRLVDKQRYNAFVDAHAAYGAALSAYGGARDRRLFNSFYSGSAATVPGQDVGLVELTVFDSKEARLAAIDALSSERSALAASSSTEAEIVVEQPDGSTDLDDFDGAALEIAVRSVSDDKREGYEQAQREFLGPLSEIDGVKTVELEIVDAPAGVTAGYSTFATPETLQNVLNYYSTDMRAFAFFGSFELVSSQIASPTPGVDPIEVPSEIPLGSTTIPEDVVVHQHKVYVSDFATGAVLVYDLFNQAAGAVELVPPNADTPRRVTWGLRVDETRNWLLVNTNPVYSFDGNVTVPCEVRAYDLARGALAGSWKLPNGTIGNAIVVDGNGKYYVGDIGPDARIIKIDPDKDEVIVWADDPTGEKWPDGGFGLGGIVFDGEGAIYGVAASADLFFRIAMNADGSAGPIEKVELVDEGGAPVTGIAADGMAMGPDGSIYYAFNDAQRAGANGVVYRVSLDSDTSGKVVVVQDGLKDPSGVFAATVLGEPVLFVNESQLGYTFGVDQGSPSKPYRVLTYRLDKK